MSTHGQHVWAAWWSISRRLHICSCFVAQEEQQAAQGFLQAASFLGAWWQLVSPNQPHMAQSILMRLRSAVLQYHVAGDNVPFRPCVGRRASRSSSGSALPSAGAARSRGNGWRAAARIRGALAGPGA